MTSQSGRHLSSGHSSGEAQVNVTNSPVNIALRAIRQWIDDGRIGRNERLPSVRAIAGELEVSTHGVWTAIKQLEQDGWIGRSGRYHIVAKTPANTPLSLASDSIVILGEAAEVGYHDLLATGFDRNLEIGAMLATRHHQLYSLMLSPQMLDEQRLDRLVAEQPRGVISFDNTLLPGAGQNILDRFRQANVPVMIYGSRDRWPEYDTIESDHEAGAYALTRLLVERGCRRILRYWALAEGTNTHVSWLKQRNDGYERAITEANLEILPPVQYNDLTIHIETREQFEHWSCLVAGHLVKHFGSSDLPVDAIMVVSDGFIFSIGSACRILGKEPGRDVLIVGYDNYWQQSHDRQWISDIHPLATVDKCNRDCGRELVNLLMARIGGELPDEPQHRRIRPNIVVIDQT